MTYFVYLLLCRDKSIYTGITTDLSRRFEEHKIGKGGHYTRSRGAQRILYSEKKRDRSSALKREAAIKRLSRDEKLVLSASKKPLIS
jgi:putative endonuclease